MFTSNIVVNSNVFRILTDDPRHDNNFVAQIQDYEKLKTLREERRADHEIAQETTKQIEILKVNLRCLYAKNDPCWGYTDNLNRITCTCINGECPNILNCNKNYSEEEANYWKNNSNEIELYGNPANLRRYYKVDMISEKEMGRYKSEPANAGKDYPIQVNPVVPDKDDNLINKKNIRIDPRTGEKMVVVGYKWMIVDNANYEGEELVPIWGYVDEVAEKETLPIKKAKRIQKKDNQSDDKLLDFSHLQDKENINTKFVYEKTVKDLTVNHVKMIAIDPGKLENSLSVIILDNPAEMAYISSMLMKNDINHGFNEETDIWLMLIENFTGINGPRNVMVSSTVLKTGYTSERFTGWEYLANSTEITELIVPEREYYNFIYEDRNNRWCCRNMYGVTHICLDTCDFLNIEDYPKGKYNIFLMEDGDTYSVCQSDGAFLGEASSDFLKLLEAMVDADEIAGMPTEINDIMLQINDSDINIIGMAHLKFLEY